MIVNISNITKLTPLLGFILKTSVLTSEEEQELDEYEELDDCLSFIQVLVAIASFQDVLTNTELSMFNIQCFSWYNCDFELYSPHDTLIFPKKWIVNG